MFEKVRGYFGAEQRQDPSSQASAEDLRLATGILLLAAAKADGSYSADEADLIYETVETTFGLPRSKVESFLNDASLELGAAGNNAQRFIEIINSSFTLEDREQILSIAWAVILADGKTSDEETKFAASLRTNLGLSLESGIRARKNAEGVGLDGFKELLEASPEVQRATQLRNESDS